MAQISQPRWLSLYASTHHNWTQSTSATTGNKLFTRPLGLVESSFDADGIYYGGRADMTATLTLHISHRLSAPELRERIVLAWTALTLQHVLLRSRVVESEKTLERRFAVDVPESIQEAIAATRKWIVFLSDFYGEEGEVDEEDLHHHALNVARIVEPAKCLSKLHVLPLKRLADGTFSLRFLIVIAHQISDGLSAYNWFSHLIRLLNTPPESLSSQITSSLPAAQIEKNLPPAQESLYPVIPGSKARQRWFWAIIRVLRHIRKPLPPTFPNPLYAPHRQTTPLHLPDSYRDIFSYASDTRPTTSSGHITATLSTAASARLIAQCRSAGVSIGAGCFALVGLSMMELHAQTQTHTQTDNPPSSPSPPPSFAASFPLNPRAFLPNPPRANSCMLTFSDGILMPYLPPSLPLTPRFKLTSRHANRELRAYQKRAKPQTSTSETTATTTTTTTTAANKMETSIFNPHSPLRHLATSYIAQLERLASKTPLSRQSPDSTPTLISPQGSLTPRPSPYSATCGISSIGSTATYFPPSTPNHHPPSTPHHDINTTKDLVANYHSLKMGVRAREGEFLVGSSTDGEGRVGFGVSFDAGLIGRGVAERWGEVVVGLMEGGGGRVKL